MFYVGQRVCCVHERHPRNGEILPRISAVYTIREFDRSHPAGDLYLRLVEIVNEPRNYTTGYLEASFWSGDFRPLVERKTDISIFRAMLNPSKQGADA